MTHVIGVIVNLVLGALACKNELVRPECSFLLLCEACDIDYSGSWLRFVLGIGCIRSAFWGMPLGYCFDL